MARRLLLLQKTRRQRTAVSSDGRNFQEDVSGHAVGRDHWPVALHAMAVRHEQLRMVERCTLTDDSQVGQRPAQERDQIINLVFGQIELANLEVDVEDVVLAEVAAAIVELDNLPDGALAPVMEVGRRQLEIAQARNLEGALCDGPLANCERRASNIRDRVGEQLLRRNLAGRERAA